MVKWQFDSILITQGSSSYSPQLLRGFYNRKVSKNIIRCGHRNLKEERALGERILFDRRISAGEQRAESSDIKKKKVKTERKWCCPGPQGHQMEKEVGGKDPSRVMRSLQVEGGSGWGLDECSKQEEKWDLLKVGFTDAFSVTCTSSGNLQQRSTHFLGLFEVDVVSLTETQKFRVLRMTGSKWWPYSTGRKLPESVLAQNLRKLRENFLGKMFLCWKDAAKLKSSQYLVSLMAIMGRDAQHEWCGWMQGKIPPGNSRENPLRASGKTS